MKVLFLNPPYFPMYSRESRSPGVTKSSTLYWPMFLAYAAGTVEADQNEMLLLDSPAMDLNLDATLNRVREFKPDLVVLGVSTPSINNDMRVAHAIKSDLNCKIAMMGTHATALPTDILSKEEAVDFVIIGEADFTARELVRHLRGDGPIHPAEILGLAYRLEGQIYRNKERPKIENLDEVPWVSKVYRKHLYSCFRRYFYGANLNPLIVILSARGCPFRCTYCVVPQTLTGHTFRTRSIKDVVDEMEWIYENFEEVGEIFFEDDTFTASPKRTLEMMEEIQKRGRKMTWSANARADVKVDVLRAMKRAGCRELCVGFESASQNVLKEVKKGALVKNAEQFMKDANRAGVIIHGCFMVGNPGDSKETLRTTLEYAKKLNPLTAQFYPIMAYPGTEAYDVAKSQGSLVSNDFDQWLDKDGHHNTTIVREGLSSQDLVDFCDTARREFYLRPRYLLRAVYMSLRNPKERYRIFRGANTLVRHLFRRHGTQKGAVESPNAHPPQAKREPLSQDFVIRVPEANTKAATSQEHAPVA